MKIKLLILFSAFLCSLFIGCSASKNSVKVNPGMNKNEVLEIMGTPGNRQFNGTREAWQYCDLKSDTENEYVVIWFNDNKVTGLTTYRYGHKYGEYITINWDKAPDKKFKRRRNK